MCYADPDASLEVGSGSQFQGERALPASAPSAPLNHESGSQRPSREGFQSETKEEDLVRPVQLLDLF